MNWDAFNRISLAHLPTPLEQLDNLRQRIIDEVGYCPQLLIKRDDQTGLATGGNKVRKLEFLVGDAIAQGADTLVTTGAGQSNHCRQTAAAAAKLGLRCVLVLSGEEPDTANGNLLLDKLLGAEIRWVANRDERTATLHEVGEELRSAGRKPYVIPIGGSVPLGALGYVAAAEELHEQLKVANQSLDRIVLVSGSGGTHAGVLVGVKALGITTVVEGLNNSPPDDITPRVRELTHETAALLDLSLEFREVDFIVHEAGTYPYATITAREREGLSLLAKTEGIILDPVYTARAFGMLIERLRSGLYASDETLLFWHTGGIAGLFARAGDVL